jgi:hypothetical protein
VTKGTFEPLRVLAELNALGVRYVLVGDLAAGAPEVPDSADSVEICVADDDDNIDRLRILMVALDAEQDQATGDPHRAAFRTAAGRLECVEMPANDGFAKLAEQATHLDFGNGVIARGVPALEEDATDWSAVAPQPEIVIPRSEVVVRPVDPRELIESVRAAAVAPPVVEEEPPPARRFRRRERDEDEYGPDPVVPTENLKPWQRVWRAFEDVDDFLNNLNERSILRPREKRDP